jgi:hypothetical protein
MSMDNPRTHAEREAAQRADEAAWLPMAGGSGDAYVTGCDRCAKTLNVYGGGSEPTPLPAALLNPSPIAGGAPSHYTDPAWLADEQARIQALEAALERIRAKAYNMRTDPKGYRWGNLPRVEKDAIQYIETLAFVALHKERENARRVSLARSGDAIPGPHERLHADPSADEPQPAPIAGEPPTDWDALAETWAAKCANTQALLVAISPAMHLAPTSPPTGRPAHPPLPHLPPGAGLYGHRVRGRAAGVRDVFQLPRVVSHG